jgi:hypothetical protein
MDRIQAGLGVVEEAQDLAESFKGKDEFRADLEEAHSSLTEAMQKLSNAGFHDWRFVYKDGQGHRLFFCSIAGRYSIADQSGDGMGNKIGRPDETDDGVLWIDPNRPCILRATVDNHTGPGKRMTWQRRHPGVDVPVITKDGEEKHCGVILEYFLDGMLKKAKMRPEVVVDDSCRYIYDVLAFIRDEALDVSPKADAE